jgi:RND family efflux transporter MFP subunit
VLNARQKLAYATLRAPEAGVITAIGANPGQTLAPGQTVAHLATRQRDAVFSVAEPVVANAPHEAKVEVRLVSNPAIAATGQVYEVSPTADAVTHTYRVRVELVAAPDAMKFGEAVTGALEYPHEPWIDLPASALTSEGDEPAVYLVDVAAKKLKRRVVKVARFDGSRVFITSGLTSGERVVTAGVSKLWPEQAVTVLEEAAR